MFYPRQMRPPSSATATALLALALAGCAGSGGDAEAPDTVTVTASPSAGPDLLSGFVCGPGENDVWRGKALLTNVGAAQNTYVVRFSVVRGPEADVLGMQEDTFTLSPGEAADVAFAEIYTGAGDGLRCVPRVTAQPSG